MSNSAGQFLSVQPMVDLLTAPYRRGAETLTIPLGADGANGTAVTPYDFTEYRARHGVGPAEPKYVLFLKTNLGRDPLEIEVDFAFPANPTVALKVPARTFAGTSFVIPAPAGADASVKLARFRQRPVPLSGAGADNFAILALLGNISKLLWLLGWEKDQIRQHLGDVQQQRRRSRAHGFSLDLLGQDLRVPRFPPREHSPDSDTIALYHLNDNFVTKLATPVSAAITTIEVISTFGFPLGLPFRIQIEAEVMSVTAVAGTTWNVVRGAQGTAASPHLAGIAVLFISNNGEVADELKRLDVPGHPGVNNNAGIGAAGKFASGFTFPGASGVAFIEISSHPDFNLPANRSFTVEAFVNVDASDAPKPRVVILKGQVDANAKLAGAGWSISLAGFRGIPNNAKWSLCDGNPPLDIFADLNIADGKFHHLAGLVDRTSKKARLFVDGEERANTDISGLGPLTNAETIRIGSSSNPAHFFSGVVDEVRLSKVARTNFHPVLGEDDEAYRQRLGLFERWLLPTPDALLKTINDAVQINNQTDSFVLIENDRPGASARKTIRIFPATLPAGQSIDRDGSTLTKESDISGTPEADLDFDPIFLLRHDKPEVDYGADPNNHLMQSGAKASLDALLDLLATASPAIAGKLIVDKAFDEAAASLHTVGRALQLHHQNLALDKLGVMAYRAGFDFVRNDGTQIKASLALGEKLEIAMPPTPPTGIDVFVGQGIDLAIAPPALPSTGQIRWTLIRCGAADAHFAVHSGDPVNLSTPLTARPRLRLIADAPGEITVRVEYTFRRRTVAGTRTIRVGINDLADQATISSRGDLNISEREAVGAPGEGIRLSYLIKSDVPGVNYGADPNNKKMQIVLERAFNALLQTQAGLAAGLQMVKSFDPADPGLHKAGRALLIKHTAINAGQLGALAHQAGFGFVRRQGNQIYCSVAAGDKIEIVRAAGLAPLEDELVAGTSVDLRARFNPLPGTGAFSWSLNETGLGSGSFDFVLSPAVRFTPGRPGVVELNINYFEVDPNATLPYTFEIRLKPPLEAANAVIPKHQYDLIMNILNYFHPIGVEVLTAKIRKHVIELEQDPLRAFPIYTYPDFQVPRLPNPINSA